MPKAKLGVMRSAPVSFLSAVGGSMPAGARLSQHQAAFAARTISSSFPSTRQIASGNLPLASRLKKAVDLVPAGGRLPIVERVGGSDGLSFLA